MKSNIGLFATMAALFMAGCSTDETWPGKDGAVEDIACSDVPITLASSARSTRASIEATPEGGFETDGLGIFCLAQDGLDADTEAYPIRWEAENATAVWINNAAAYANYRVSEGNIVGTRLAWSDGRPRFYPLANLYTYEFYGYHPRVEDNALTYNESRIEARIPIDGTQDIIWARTHANHPEAYSARYFRRPEYIGKAPVMSFEHKLVRMTFCCVAGTNAQGSIDQALAFGIKSIRIKDMPSAVTLVIADRNEPLAEGTIRYDRDTATSDFELHDYPDMPFGEEHWVLPEETGLGQGFLLPALPEGESYTMEITLKDRNGREYVSERPIELQQNSVYEAGKSYRVKLIVYGPKTILPQATLVPWETDRDETLEDVTPQS